MPNSVSPKWIKKSRDRRARNSSLLGQSRRAHPWKLFRRVLTSQGGTALMNQSIATAPESLKEIGLPRRDWILMISLSLLTLVALVCAMELVARRVIPESGAIAPACIVI